MTDNEARLAEIEGRLAAATPGPWGASPEGDVPPSAVEVHYDFAEGDATFIAHAPADIAWLVQGVRRLREGLRTYGRHGGDCAKWYQCPLEKHPEFYLDDGKPCTCGYAALLAGTGGG